MDQDIHKTTYITKFDIKGKILYVKVIWKQNPNDLFHIKIFDGDVAWSGRFSHEFAKKYRERFELTEENYNKQVKTCLRDSAHDGFAYDFVVNPEDKDSATFTWKRRFEDDMHEFAVLVHGSVPVHRDASPESKDTLLDFVLQENKELRTTIQNLNQKNEVINADLKKCKNELEKFVDVKTSTEASLYGKFVQLLNAKKRRIQVLEGNLHKFSSDSKLVKTDPSQNEQYSNGDKITQ